MSILITGGTGWIGKNLIPRLKQPVQIVTRNQKRASERMSLPSTSFIECDLSNAAIPANQLSDIDCVINLVGDSVAEGRWTKKKKQKIRESRIAASSHLVHSLIKSHQMPRVVVSASAIGYYGDRGDDFVDETAGPGNDFLAEVCVDWERAMLPLIDRGVRVCFLRIGIVLGQGGGALEKMLMPFKMGLGGKLGSGQQWMSWIHMDDLVSQILFLIKNESLSGPFNGTAPEPVRNEEFTTSLGKAVGRPTLLAVPGFALKMGLGQFAEFLLASQKVVPEKFEASGFEFDFPSLESALNQIVR